MDHSYSVELTDSLIASIALVGQTFGSSFIVLMPVIIIVIIISGIITVKTIIPQMTEIDDSNLNRHGLQKFRNGDSLGPVELIV